MIILAFFLFYFYLFFFAWGELTLDDNPASFQLEGMLIWKLTDLPTSKDHKLVKLTQINGGENNIVVIFLFYLVKMFNKKADSHNCQPPSSLKGNIF